MASKKLEKLNPLDLLKELGSPGKSKSVFNYIQVLAECVGYDPVVEGVLDEGEEWRLSEWEYETSKQKEKVKLTKWAKEKDVQSELCECFERAATDLVTRAVGRVDTHDQTLEEIVTKLKIDKAFKRKTRKKYCEGLVPDSYWEKETFIREKLLDEILKRAEALSDKERDQLDQDLGEQLKKAGVEVGQKSALDYLRLGGEAAAATGVAWGATSVTTGVILGNLGVWNSVLLALGLYSVPTLLIGAGFFAPILAALAVFRLGGHNYAKTLPFVVALATIRQDLIQSRDQRNKRVTKQRNKNTRRKR